MRASSAGERASNHRCLRLPATVPPAAAPLLLLLQELADLRTQLSVGSVEEARFRLAGLRQAVDRRLADGGGALYDCDKAALRRIDALRRFIALQGGGGGGDA